MTAIDAEMQGRLAAVRGRLRAQVAGVVTACAEEIAEQARANCPVESGRLRESIGVAMSAEGDGVVVTARVSAEAPYAAAVELGAEEVAPQPFLWPAMERLGPVLMRALREALGGG